MSEPVEVGPSVLKLLAQLALQNDVGRALLTAFAEGKGLAGNFEFEITSARITSQESGQIQAGGLPDPTAPLAAHSRTLS